MSTTTIRLDEQLRSRVAAAAERAGKSQHAFIVEAIARTVEQAEREEDLHRVADERWAQVLASGRRCRGTRPRLAGGPRPRRAPAAPRAARHRPLTRR
ncbi:MAG: CopG family transcriptional regulator [Comamonadaceae bacterium]|nr:CopG family transcriptional regulator [Comamonadaceae bacterium]